MFRNLNWHDVNFMTWMHVDATQTRQVVLSKIVLFVGHGNALRLPYHVDVLMYGIQEGGVRYSEQALRLRP